MKFSQLEGATLLSPEDSQNLLVKHITTQAELNVFEAANILIAKLWLSRHRTEDIFSHRFIKDLHKHMFHQVWKWAGQYRTLQTNIGIEPHRISVELGQLLNDVYYYIDKKVCPMDETAVRFHHKLTFIHPFPNGNGRHARLATDYLLKHHGHQPFSWGQGSLVKAGELRKQYIAALQEADKHNFEPLLKFARNS